MTGVARRQETLAPAGVEDPLVAVAFGGNELAGAATITVNGIAVGVTDPISFQITERDLPYEVCVAIIRQLGRVNRWSRWALADAILYTEGAHGERYAQAANFTGLSPDTIKNLVYVAMNVPRSRRRSELGISIHAEVAPLEPEEQRVWLDKAAAEDWTRDVLRAEIKRAREAANGGPLDPIDGKPAPGELLTRRELVEQAASRVWREAQPDGGYFRVPREAMAALGAALGEGE